MVVSLGHVFILTSLNFSIQTMSDPHNVAYTAAMYTFMRTLGMCIGVAAGGAAGGVVFQNQLKKHHAYSRLLTTVATDAQGFVATPHALPTDSPNIKIIFLRMSSHFRKYSRF